MDRRGIAHVSITGTTDNFGQLLQALTPFRQSEHIQLVDVRGATKKSWVGKQYTQFHVIIFGRPDWVAAARETVVDKCYTSNLKMLYSEESGAPEEMNKNIERRVELIEGRLVLDVPRAEVH
jgi:hypothetical protein